jgi:hypothetical protein
MDPVRFDQLSKRLAVGISRRRAVQALGAAGLAGTFFALRRQPAAADCPDRSALCMRPISENAEVSVNGAEVKYGQCWNWSRFVCEPCPGAIDVATKRCNETWTECQGQCIAWSPPQ